MGMSIRATVWNEFRHERKDPEVTAIYPRGIHETIAAALRAEGGLQVRTATLDEPEHGLGGDVLANTDVLLWWGHMAHEEVSDAVAARVQARVLEGMGLVVLHSAHMSKPFTRLMGTSCLLRWREAGEKERLWVVEPGHPIVDGIGPYFEIPHEEMYGERFDIPAPDATVLISWFAGGNVFRSGCCFTRGKGRIFYFRPGHETFPTYLQPEVQRVIRNAVKWAAPGNGPVMKLGDPEPPLERL
ncbi:MAG TPA: ThuA domain-containing protein [Spirochaetia bacterium]|nr:ThuA domain-containing protein [Spirochaetia bacterium]